MAQNCKCPACNPINQPNFEYVAPRKLTLKERIHKQRMENFAASDRAFEYVQANQGRYAEHRASVLAERAMAKTGFVSSIGESVTDAAHYVGGITKAVGDTVTSSVESVLKNPSVIADTVNNVASTIVDGVTYFPDVVLDEVAPDLSYGAKDRTNKRIDNALDGISEGLDQLGDDLTKHNQAFSSGDFESAGAVVGGYVSSAVLPFKKIKALGGKGVNKSATFGTAISKDYKKTFFDENPYLKGKVVVHHAVEQQVQRRYPGLVNDSEMHSLENLRGIPNEKNGDLHLSKIRKEWNRFYKTNPNPSKDDLLNKTTEIDQMFGSEFNPPLN